jgi:hypothetical protein
MTIIHGFTSFNTTDPNGRPLPTVTPGPTKASAQMHESVPIAIGGRNNGKSDFV